MLQTSIFCFFFTFAASVAILMLPATTVSASALLQFPQTWSYLGPFLYGKTEVDGDPLAAFGGLTALYNQRNSKNKTLGLVPSEAVPGGSASWRTVKMRPLDHPSQRHYGELSVDAREMQQLQQQMRGDESLLEFVGFAVAKISVPSDGDYVFEIFGIHTIWALDRESGLWVPHIADQYGRGVLTTMHLEAGQEQLLCVRMRGVGQANFRIRSLRNHKPRITVKNHEWVSDLVCDRAVSKTCEFYLGNVHTSISAMVMSHALPHHHQQQQQHSHPPVSLMIDPSSPVANFLEIDANPNPPSLAPFCADAELIDDNPFAREMLCNSPQSAAAADPDANLLPAGGSRLLSRSVKVTDPAKAFGACGGDKPRMREDIAVTVIVRVGDDEHKLQYSMRCRKIDHDTFTVSYRDFDGAPAHASMVLPLERNNVTAAAAAAAHKDDLSPSSVPAARYPVYVTLHGTGVASTSQADAHKFAPKSKPGQFQFGGSGVVIIAPSRAGAHNHEFVAAKSNFFAPLLISAIMRQRAAAVGESDMIGVVSPLLRNMIPDIASGLIASGHSMGSRGAMVLATQLATNYLIGLCLLGVWIRKEDYSSANRIFHPSSDRSADKLAYGRRRGIIEGSVADQDLVLENIVHVPIFLRTGAQDTTTPPFWARRLYRLLREAGARNVTLSEPKSTVDGAAGHWWWSTRNRDDGGVVWDAPIRKMVRRCLEAKDASRQSVGEGGGGRTTATIVSYAPTTVALGRRSSTLKLRLLQQLVVGEKSKLSVSLLSRRAGAGESAAAASGIVVVDHAENVMRFSVNGIDYCVGSEKTSAVTKCSSERQSKPFSPIRQYSEAPFFVAAIASSSPVVYDIARYLAQTHLVAYETDVTLVVLPSSSSSPAGGLQEALAARSHRRSLIVGCLEGGNLQQQQELLDLVGVEVTSEWITIGESKIMGKNLTIVTIFASSHGARGGVALISQTLYSLNHVATCVATPVPPPMVRSAFGNLLPDFFVVDADLASDGYGSFVAAGFFASELRSGKLVVEPKSSYFPINEVHDVELNAAEAEAAAAATASKREQTNGDL